MAVWLDSDMFRMHAPSLFPSFSLSPTVCADVNAAAKAHSEERDLDAIVRGRFHTSLNGHDQMHTSRLLRLLAEARGVSQESDPLAALASLLREVNESRALHKRLLKATGETFPEGALVSIEVSRRELLQYKAEEAVCTKLGHEGWREAAAELEILRRQVKRITAFVGAKGASAEGPAHGVETALATLQTRERERLKLLRMRNDVLGAVGLMRASKGSGVPGAAKGSPGGGGQAADANGAADDGEAAAVNLVRELVEAAEGIKRQSGGKSLADAAEEMRGRAVSAEAALEEMRAKMHSLHRCLSTTTRSLPQSLHSWWVAEAEPYSEALPGSGADEGQQESLEVLIWGGCEYGVGVHRVDSWGGCEQGADLSLTC